MTILDLVFEETALEVPAEESTVLEVDQVLVIGSNVAGGDVTQQELDDETTAREAADTSLQAAIDAEVIARGTAVTAEATARATADGLLIPLSQKGAAGGVATLDGGVTVPDAQLAANIVRTSVLTAAVQAAVDALLAGAPSALDTLKELADAIGDDANFAATVTAALAAKVDKAVLTNDGDLLTRASGAITRITRAALAGDSAWASVYVALTDPRLTDARTPTAHAASHGSGGTDAVTVAQSQVSGLTAALALLAPLVSPTFTGTPAVPTAAAGTNTTQAASTAFVKAAIDALIAGAPGALDTLKELADAINDDASFAASVTTALAGKVALAGSTSTGEQVAPSFNASGKSGATAFALILAGSTSSGAPASGAHLKGEVAGDATGKLWYCTVAGTPGTWVQVGADRFGLTPTATKTSNYTAAAGELVICDSTAGGFTVQMPTAPADGSVVGVKHSVQGGSNLILYSTATSGASLDGGVGTAGFLVFAQQTVVLQYRASDTAWFVVANYLPYASLDARYYPLVAESHGDVSVVNSTSDTPVANLTLPAGAVTTGDVVRLTAYGDYLNNSGSTATYIPKVKFGSTTALTGGSISRATNGNRGKWWLTVDIAIESTTAQRIGATLQAATPSANNFDAIAVALSYTGYGTSAEDTSTSKAVQFTITPSAANAALDWVCHAASLEVLKKR